MQFLLFILATIGVILITNKSKLFKPLRERVTRLRTKHKDNKFYWWLDSILNCSTCISPYAGALMYVVQYFDLEILLYMFAVVTCTVLFMDVLQMIERK